ncbi:MAG: intermembrane transport protein PqiB [Janthinobacterium lividum]|uniref:PqiB family protein n=1 Tax=Pseudomonas TaxID=286 RepID=UPI001CFB61D3|nr:MULTISPECIES: MlaD family protein [Pseudomonas]
MSEPVADPSRTPGNPDVRRRRFNVSLVWLVPIVAAVIGLSMVVHNSLSAGPKITVSFETAEGLEANKTQVKYKNVVIGQVTAIALSEDRNRVVATIELKDSAKSFTTEDSRFWVVRPRIGAQGISGVDTLLSGAFISADPGASKQTRSDFRGLEIPPPITYGQRGKRFSLHADDLGSLDIGSPVYYRRIQVGQVVQVGLSQDGKGVDIEVFVNSPNDEFVTTNTRFWNASGVDISLGADGLKVNTQSVSSIVSGGVAFVEPKYNPDQKQAAEMTKFDLFADQQSALAPPDGTPRYIRMRFDQSLRGLTVGSQVEFLGVNLGRVVSIDLDYDAKTQTFPTMVGAVIFPDRLGKANDKLTQIAGKGNEDAQAAKMLSEFVKHGLRAQARTGNLLTGQLYISLAFLPKVAPVNFDMSARPLEIPTAPGSFDKLQEQLQAMVDKVSKLPIEQIADNLNGSLDEMHKTLSRFNGQVLPELADTMAQTRKTMAAAADTLGDDSPQRQQIGQAMDEVQRTARSVRVLTDFLGRHPESLIRGRVSEGSPDAYRSSGSSSRDIQLETKP